jgi:hypothetical protein
MYTAISDLESIFSSLLRLLHLYSLAMVIAFGSLFAFGDISFLSANPCTAIFAIQPSDSTPDLRFANAIGSRFHFSLS